MSENKIITFSHSENKDFSTTLRKRVNEYFKDKGITKFGNIEMYTKTVVMIAIYFVPLILMLTGVVTSGLILLLLAILMGVGMAGIGLAVMHDANHGSYSSNKKVNQVVGYILNVVGGNSFNWRVQHNVLHHSYTNVHDMDEDIDPIGVLRFSPHAKLRKIHKFQFIYAWFFYGLMTLSWVVDKDFVQFFRFRKKNLIASQKTTFGKELTILIFSKVWYYALILLLPMLFMEITFLQWLVGFLALHFTTGLILALIFQPAHVLEDTTFPLPDLGGKIDDNFMVHQLKTTANFAPKSRIFSWFVGGLNFQIEHHLFPNICHIHYKKISKIVKETTQEFGLPYYEKKTFVAAVISHGKMLHKLGRK